MTAQLFDKKPPLHDDHLDNELSRILNEVFSGRLQDSERGRIDPGRVLILPPDTSRIHSRAGFLSGVVCRELAKQTQKAALNKTGAPYWQLGGIMPALGTHRPLSPEEIRRMFPACPEEQFISHCWRSDTVELGRLEADWVETAFACLGSNNVLQQNAKTSVSSRIFRTEWPVEVNRLLRDGPVLTDNSLDVPVQKPFSLIISIGQVVPHEIAGMANHAKNIFIGTGGKEAIHKSHWLGALYGLERLMGKTENPVRALLDEALHRYGHLLPPILWVLTVVDSGNQVRGFFCGFGRACFEKAAALSEKVNIITESSPLPKSVVYLDPGEYRSTWLGNKAIYRTRKAIMDGGELIILAPGIDCFGEDPGMDTIIRRYGYRGADAVKKAVESETDLKTNLGAAAHLIHGSSEDRFTIRYCTAGGTSGSANGTLLNRSDIESVGYEWGNLEESAARYIPLGPLKQKEGWNTALDGERYYFIRNPGLGLWTV